MTKHFVMRKVYSRRGRKNKVDLQLDQAFEHCLMQQETNVLLRQIFQRLFSWQLN